MLSAGRGQVVNVSSGLAFIPTAGESAYVATKAAVLQLSLCLRADWAAQGVGVTAICPGFINTPIPRTAHFTGGQEDPTGAAQLVTVSPGPIPPKRSGAPSSTPSPATGPWFRWDSNRSWAGMPIGSCPSPSNRHWPEWAPGAEIRLMPSLHLPRSRRSLLAVGAAAAIRGRSRGLQAGPRTSLHATHNGGQHRAPAKTRHDTRLGRTRSATSSQRHDARTAARSPCGTWEWPNGRTPPLLGLQPCHLGSGGSPPGRGRPSHCPLRPTGPRRQQLEAQRGSPSRCWPMT